MTTIGMNYLEINMTTICEVYKPIGGYRGPGTLESGLLNLSILNLWTTVSIFRENRKN